MRCILMGLVNQKVIEESEHGEFGDFFLLGHQWTEEDKDNVTANDNEEVFTGQ